MMKGKIYSNLTSKVDDDFMSTGSILNLSLNDSYSSSLQSSFSDGLDEINLTHVSKSNDRAQNSIFPTTDTPVVSLLNEAWEYRGEGGANLVISVTDKRKIIRFKKT